MSLNRALLWLQSCIILFAVTSTTWLYFYPVFKGCAFPSTTESQYDGFKDTLALHRRLLHEHAESRAPFRLLVLADPQLEGDSSLPDPEDALTARIALYWARLRGTNAGGLKAALQEILRDLFSEDIPRALWTARKRVDLFGNDYYLAHIYRTLHWWTLPTHVTVLGDLIGSQWVSDDEFEWRGWRYWNRVLAGSHHVDEELMTLYQKEKAEQTAIQLESQDSDWSRKVINIVGNHDIGYAGDISRSRIDRFESVFGRVNWDLHFSYPEYRVPQNHTATDGQYPSLHLIVLNSMILDTPAFDEDIQRETYEYLNGLISTRLDSVGDRDSTFTLLLTHVPLQKPEGICVDAPFFDFWDYADDDGAFKNGGLKEQNHLSEHSSQSGVLQGIFGMSGNQDAAGGGKGRNGLILNGHDHAGCDVMHYIERITRQKLIETQVAEQTIQNNGSEDQDQQEEIPTSTGTDMSWLWASTKTQSYNPANGSTIDEEGRQLDTEHVTSLREITLRSMMGEYSGNAGLLSLWYDFDLQTWKYDIQMCSLGVQHIWWAVHVLDIVATVILILQAVRRLVRSRDIVRSVAETRTDTKLRLDKHPADQRLDRVARVPGHERSPSERRRKG